MMVYSKTCVKWPLSKRPEIGFQNQLSLNAGQKYCGMLMEYSAILSTFIKLPFVIKIFVLPIFEWPFYTGFTVYMTNVFLSTIPMQGCNFVVKIAGLVWIPSFMLLFCLVFAMSLCASVYM